MRRDESFVMWYDLYYIFYGIWILVVAKLLHVRYKLITYSEIDNLGSEQNGDMLGIDFEMNIRQHYVGD